MKTRAAIGIGIALVLAAGAVRSWFPAPQEDGYRFVKAWGRPGSGPGEFNEPIGIAIGGERIFVSDSGNDRLQVFDREGGFIDTFGRGGDQPGEVARPMHLDVWDGKLYVA